MTEPSLLELMASKICHDLISPVGAVHNGVEFMEEMGAEDGSPALALITRSVAQASARLQVFRMVYGTGGRDENMRPSDVFTAFGAFIELDGKITQNWDPQDLGEFTENPPLGVCKLLMGALMLAQEALPRGGGVSVNVSGAGGLSVTAEAEDARLPQETLDALDRSVSLGDLDPRFVHAYIVSLMAEQYGYQVSVAAQNAGAVEIRIERL